MFGELGHLGRRQVQTGGTQELVRLGLVQTQLVMTDLDREAARPQRTQWQRGPASCGEHQLRALRDMPGQLGDGGQAARVVEEVQVIEDQNRSLVHRREGCRDARHHGSLDRSAGRRQCVEHARVELRDAVERGRDVRQQDDRVVVVLVDGHPCERTPRARAPLRQQRRLPPTGTGGQRNHRGRVRLLQQSMSALRGTALPRSCGARSFDSNNSNAGADLANRPAGAREDARTGRNRRGHDITGRRGPCAALGG